MKSKDIQEVIDTIDWVDAQKFFISQDMRHWRLKNKISVRKMSEMMNKEFTGMYISMVELGDCKPSKKFLEQLLKIFK